MRYEGQNYEQEIPVPERELSEDSLEQIYDRYHDLHEEFYGYRLDGLPIELVRLTVTATVADAAGIPDLSLETKGGIEGSAPPGRRTVQAHFGDGFEDTQVVPRAELTSEVMHGPLIVESMDTTVVVPPGWTVEADAVGALDMRRNRDEQSSGAAVGAAVSEG